LKPSFKTGDATRAGGKVWIGCVFAGKWEKLVAHQVFMWMRATSVHPRVGASSILALS
jgi:hypothetical protein